MKTKINSNYHTHTYLCKHAIGAPMDYIERAISCNYQVIGMSDHGPLKEDFRKMLNSRRMNFEEFNHVYLPLLEEAKQKYGDKIKIYTALEYEYFKDMDEIYPQFLEKLDYLVLGQHYYEYKGEFLSPYGKMDEEKLRCYVDNVVEAIETGYFKILAHPDLFLWNYPQWDEVAISQAKRILSAAEKQGMFVEINANGIRNAIIHNLKRMENGKAIYPYPNRNFFELAKKYHVKFIINDDAHNPAHIYDEYTIETIELAEELQIEVLTGDILNKY